MSTLCFKIKRRVKISPLPERAGGVSLGWAVPGVPGFCELSTGHSRLCLPSTSHSFGLKSWASVEAETGDRHEPVFPERDQGRWWRRVFPGWTAPWGPGPSCSQILWRQLYHFPAFFFFLPLCVACGILVPWPGIEPVPPVTEAQSLNHWSTREVPPFSWLYNEESGAHLTPEVIASNCRWCPLGRGKRLSLQGEVLEQSVSVGHMTVAMKPWLNSPRSVSLGRTAATLQERSPFQYLAVSGVFLFGMFDSLFSPCDAQGEFSSVFSPSHYKIGQKKRKKHERKMSN